MVYKNLFKTKRTDDWKKVQNFRNIGLLQFMRKE